MARVILLNKPFGVLSQFTGEPGQHTLKPLVPVPGVYPAGRLDADSEGLLVLTDNGALQARLSHPRHKQDKTYVAQVEGCVTEYALHQLRAGVLLKDGPPYPPASALSLNSPGCGHATRPCASGAPSPRPGSRSRCARAVTARCAA